MVESGAAGAVVAAHLRSLRADVLDWLPRVRRGEDDAVHQLRVTVRRLRATVAAFGPLVTAAPTTQLRRELGWLADVLGTARDAEVVGARLATLAGALPDDVAEPVRRRLADARRRAQRATRAQVSRACGSERLARLLAELGTITDEPLTGASLEGPVGVAFRSTLRRDSRRVARAWRAACAAPAGPARDEAWHRTRRRTKRLRYAAEATLPASGARVARLAAVAKDLQSLLGDHHDTVLVRAQVRVVGGQAEAAGEDGAPYRTMHALEQARADELAARVPTAWRAFDHRRRRLARA